MPLSPALLHELAELDCDWRLIPVDDRKRPVDPASGLPRDDWAGHAVSPDQIEAFSDSPHVHAVGLVLGPASGILAVDFDGDGSTAQFQEVFGRTYRDLPPTIGWSSGRPNRRQYAFRVPLDYWPHLRGRRSWKRHGRNVLELRWTGHQSVIAGAHPDTAGYHWIKGGSPADLEPADAPDWLLEPLFKPAHETADTDYQPTADDAARALALLQHIQPRDDYDSWLRVGMALHSADPGLLEHWITWSRGCSNFDEEECRNKWPSFKGRGITPGTLHWFATQDGYIPPIADDDFEWNPPEEILDEATQQPQPQQHTEADLTEEIEYARQRLNEQLQNLDAALDIATILPPVIAKALIDKARSMSADPVAFLGPLLTATASVVGTRAVVRVNQGWSEPFVIWAGNILPPSHLKTPILNAIGDPLLARQEAEIKAHREELRQAQRENNQLPPEIAPPRRWLVSDTSYERLAQIVAEPRTVGIWSYQDELAGWFERLDARQSAGARAGWLTLWGGGAALIDRKVAASSMALRTSVSLFGNVQPERLLSMIEAGGDDAAAAGDGLWSRFLWCRPPHQPWRYQPHGVSIYNHIAGLVAALDGLPQSLASDADPTAVGFELRLPADSVAELAAPAWEAWADDALSSSPARAAFLGKLRGYSVRLMGLLWLLDLAEGAQLSGTPLANACSCDPVTGTWFSTVPPTCIAYGLILSDWYRAQFDALASELGSTDLRAPVARFLRLVRETGAKDVTPRQVVIWRVFGRQKISTADALRFLRQLVEVYGHGHMAAGRRRGSMVWRPGVDPSADATSQPVSADGPHGGPNC